MQQSWKACETTGSQLEMRVVKPSVEQIQTHIKNISNKWLNDFIKRARLSS